jgi:adenosylcobinamide-phosphate synthase
MFPFLAADPARLDPLLALLAALVLDALVGDPPALFGRVPHPVALLGRLAAGLERRWNRDDLAEAARRLRGVACVALMAAIAALVGFGLDALAAFPPVGGLVEILVIAVLVAQRSLYDHVAAVARALAAEGLAGGRAAVAHIVGRDPESLDEHGVARAAIESLAENFSDGVVAPVFWFLVLGLPGICVYKAVNTLDSMIGHRSERYRAFGWAAARLDDAANFIPARIAGAMIALAAALVPAASAGAAWAIMLRDAATHRSPNAGWPEAAMAGALRLALAGPRRYGAETVADPWLGDGTQEATEADIRRGLRVYVAACAVNAAAAAALALARRAF